LVPNSASPALGWATINGWHMRIVFVPPAANDGSAFAHHVVFILDDRLPAWECLRRRPLEIVRDRVR
jgi:hypothetical protein